MALPTSSLSQVCREIATVISDGLNASANSIRVMIGSPADAVPGQSDTQHRINLFFYRIEPSGYFPGGLPGEPWWLRLYCLVTGFGIPEDQISAGENDLRLLGEVMRLFHETPVLEAFTVDDETFRLEVIFQPLNPDDLNHIWSTQGEVSYRPSVVYEMALAPVVPRERTPGSPLVGAVGSQLRGDMATRSDPFGGVAAGPAVYRTVVDASREDWAPAICLVVDGHCAQSLSFVDGSPALAAFTPSIWVAGALNAPVELVWEKWTSSGGWERQPTTLGTVATTTTIDPDTVDGAVTAAFDLPFAAHETGQAVLFAQRTYQRAVDGQAIVVRSNPILVTIYAEAP
ncbi:conserved hypothetical protein [Desulfosarcina cetonica]|uniref:DUF4255 domain-containing protein n=1 Tax=Desulfosarcina cetonica TaxID=90730 RepID=UPI0006CF56B9|nr:DUF4255 domain-containing protein [Desulfosarcina cetonica]VTR66646.1 conserved hypothetical protein [Desulfosarcina cetonica]